MTKKKIIRYGISFNERNWQWEVRAVCGYSQEEWYLVYSSWKYERASNYQKIHNNILLTREQYFCLYTNDELEQTEAEEAQTIITIDKAA